MSVDRWNIHDVITYINPEIIQMRSSLQYLYNRTHYLNLFSIFVVMAHVDDPCDQLTLSYSNGRMNGSINRITSGNFWHIRPDPDSFGKHSPGRFVRPSEWC